MHSGSKQAHLDFKALLNASVFDDSMTGSWLQCLSHVCMCVCVLCKSNKRVEEALQCARMLKWMSFECSGSPGMQI